MANLEMNSSSFKILVTRMRERDLEEVLAIENNSFQSPWTKGMFLLDLDTNPFARSVVVRFPGETKIIGYACFWIVMPIPFLLAHTGPRPEPRSGHRR